MDIWNVSFYFWECPISILFWNVPVSILFLERPINTLFLEHPLHDTLYLVPTFVVITFPWIHRRIPSFQTAVSSTKSLASLVLSGCIRVTVATVYHQWKAGQSKSTVLTWLLLPLNHSSRTAMTRPLFLLSTAHRICPSGGRLLPTMTKKKRPHNPLKRVPCTLLQSPRSASDALLQCFAGRVRDSTQSVGCKAVHPHFFHLCQPQNKNTVAIFSSVILI